jgi:hypothetical protein
LCWKISFFIRIKVQELVVEGLNMLEHGNHEKVEAIFLWKQKTFLELRCIYLAAVGDPAHPAFNNSPYQSEHS